MPRTLIFVPTYNERDNVESMATQLLGLPLDADLLFMDDSSADGTGEILDRLAESYPRLSVIHRPGKLGIGSAHLDGIRQAYDLGYERLITLDCDFTHSPADVLRLVEHSKDADVTTGSRYMAPGSLPGWNPLRRSLTGLGHVMTRHLLGILPDATGALRAYNLLTIPRELFDLIKARGYGFFFESMFVLVRNRCSVAEFPIVLPARTYGSSKMTVRETWRSGSRLLGLWKESILDPSRFRLAPRAAEIDPALVDPQGWDSYWDKKDHASSKAYELIARVYRVSVIRAQLRRFLRRHFDAGSHVLHAGAGSGQVDEGMHDRLRITAVDISPSAVRLYRANNPDAYEVRHADIRKLPFDAESFDGAYNLGVMEHFTRTEIAGILQELNRVLKPGGRLVVFWPHARATSVAVLKAAHWLMNDVAGKKMQFHPPEVSLLPSKQWAESLLREGGFQVERYSFGPRDLFVQAVIVAQKATPAAN